MSSTYTFDTKLNKTQTWKDNLMALISVIWTPQVARIKLNLEFQYSSIFAVYRQYRSGCFLPF